ncbi:MAG: CehA/McbA family metallohydrolase [Planctomycetia bacterium]|nr:CehA/McbA family metallohydrolase [Planctomycetia bacterium]
MIRLSHPISFLAALALLIAVAPAAGAERVLTSKLHHVRSGATREWADFPAEAEAERLRIAFTAEPNAAEATLRIRHRDVKQTWSVRINDREIGKLPTDENDVVTFWTVPTGILKAGDNVLLVSSDGKISDDVELGDVRLDDRPQGAVLSETRVAVSVTDENRQPIPCRLTIVDANGSLVTTSISSQPGLAVRPGVIYTRDGRATFGLPAGRYTLYAGRGFEYGVVSAPLTLEAGATIERQLTLHREVPTPGLVACDTHCHTLTFSGHGDATLDERLVTIAGEGIELPIATDHNRNVDYETAARAAEVRKYFTPAIGNEVTTPRMGHFNVFPIAADASPVEAAATDWPALFAAIRDCPGVIVTVFNHPRDVHGGYRPFGPEHHLSLVGENLDGWKLEANAIELVNSGALQSDVLQVYRDWFGLLNRGIRIAPVGASDSHDVARYFVGQGRTYLRCDDRNPGGIDVNSACRSLADGHVMVSLGLLCEISVNGKSGPGDLVSPADELTVDVRVLGPSWTKAESVALYANGFKIRDAKIEPGDAAGERGVKWKGTWRLPRFAHDVHLVAIALGPGVKELYWPISRPYQPSTPVWNSYVVGSTGAVWIDADGSGSFNPAFEYATRLVDKSAGDFTALVLKLADYDEAVAAQAARLAHVCQLATPADLLAAAARTDHGPIRNGFLAYGEAWRECETARLNRK